MEKCNILPLCMDMNLPSFKAGKDQNEHQTPLDMCEGNSRVFWAEEPLFKNDWAPSKLVHPGIPLFNMQGNSSTWFLPCILSKKK
jgi:hypothetical protein